MPTLPPKRKRLALRLAGIAVGIAVLAVVYQLTRPQELVWWTTDSIGHAKCHFSILVPAGWEVQQPYVPRYPGTAKLSAYYQLLPVDRTPKYLQWLVHPENEAASLFISLEQYPNEMDWPALGPTDVVGPTTPEEPWKAKRYMRFREKRLWVSALYSRKDKSAFNRTYKQICNSLKIE
jgi:hypothetical protein